VVVSAAAVLPLAACGGDDSSDPAAAQAAPAPFSVLSPTEGAALLEARGDAVTLIDVRTPAEYAEGHLAGATLLDIQDPSFEERLSELAPDGAYVVYCRSGNRSAAAVEAMRQAGFREVYDLGGIIDWQAAGLPVVTS
jgi:rhodanese-related sulfurtransferase